LSGAVRAAGAPRLPNADFAAASFACARATDAALAAVALFTTLRGPFDAAGFLAGAAFASLFAAPRVRDALPAAELGLFRFRFEGFATIFFIFARIVFRAARALDVGFLLPTRLRTLDEDASLTRFDAAFALEADLVFFAFDFVVFFDLLRAAIVKLSTRRYPRIRSKPMRQRRYPKRRAEFLSTKPRFLRGIFGTSAPRLIARLAQNRREIKEEDEPAPPTTVAHG